MGGRHNRVAGHEVWDQRRPPSPPAVVAGAGGRGSFSLNSKSFPWWARAGRGALPTIPRMLQNLNALLAPALMDRLVLVVNHVISAEPQAVQRLVPHRGRVLRLELLQLPRLLPAPPPLAFTVTPAGLVEWCRDPVDADLRVRLDAPNPAALALQALTGQMPPLVIEGDVQLATDIDWLLKNLRWDVADDLERLFGPTVAHELHRLGASLARALRGAMQGATVAAGRVRNR